MDSEDEKIKNEREIAEPEKGRVESESKIKIPTWAQFVFV